MAARRPAAAVVSSRTFTAAMGAPCASGARRSSSATDLFQVYSWFTLVTQKMPP